MRMANPHSLAMGVATSEAKRKKEKKEQRGMAIFIVRESEQWE